MSTDSLDIVPISWYNPGMKRSFAGTQILILRGAKGWTQPQLASRSGVTRDVIAKIEAGSSKSLKLEDAIKLARALEIPVGDLVDV